MADNHMDAAPPSGHVFVLMLENRSFDQMLGMSMGTVGTDAATGTPTTIDGPTDQSNEHDGDSYPVGPGAPYVMPVDPPHEFCDVQMQMASIDITDGDCVYSGQYPPITMGGFVDNYALQAAADD